MTGSLIRIEAFWSLKHTFRFIFVHRLHWHIVKQNADIWKPIPVILAWTVKMRFLQWWHHLHQMRMREWCWFLLVHQHFQALLMCTGKMLQNWLRGCNFLLISFESVNSSFQNVFMWMRPEYDLPGVYEDCQGEQSHLTGKRPRHFLQLLRHEL